MQECMWYYKELSYRVTDVVIFYTVLSRELQSDRQQSLSPCPALGM